MKAAIQAPGPSFRDMQFCTGGGYFLDAWQKHVELVSVTFQTATFGSEGGHPSTRSILQGHAVLHWRRLLFGRLAEARGASFSNVPDRQRLAVKAAIQAPGPSFRDMQLCTGGGYFLDAWQKHVELVFVTFQTGNVRQWRRPSKHQVHPSGTCSFALAEATFWTLGRRTWS